MQSTGKQLTTIGSLVCIAGFVMLMIGLVNAPSLLVIPGGLLALLGFVVAVIGRLNE